MKKKIDSQIFILAALLSVTLISPSLYAEEGVRQRLSIADQRKFDYFYYEGVNLKNAGKIDAALDMFRHCLSIDSTSSVVLFEIASYCIQVDKMDQAVGLMKNAVQYTPDNQEYRRTLATLLFNAGMFGEAVDEYEILSDKFPEKPEFLYYLAESYSRMGDIEKALETYDRLENFIGMNEALTMEKYQLYMTLEQPDKAFNELKKLAAKYPTESRYLLIIGDLYLQLGDKKHSLEYYEKAHQADPESPYYHVSMANYYEMLNLGDSAKNQINSALVNEALDVNIKLNILARYIVQQQRSKQDTEGITKLFNTLLEQHPDEARLRLAYGEYLSMSNKNDEARFQYQIVTESEPGNIAAWQQLLNISLQTRDYDEVIRICGKCQELFPEYMEFYLYQGIAYFQKKEYQSAIDTYQSAIPLIPAENKALISDFYGQIGDTYFRMQQTDKAFEAYEESLNYNDKNIGILNNYAYYLSLLKKDLTKAERMSAMSIKLEPENATYLDTYAWIFFVQGNYSLARMYIESAIAKDRRSSAELFDHYGDILYLSGEKEKAVEQWIKAREAGKKSVTLEKKIAEKTYFEETKEELFDDDDMENEADNTEQ